MTISRTRPSTRLATLPIAITPAARTRLAFATGASTASYKTTGSIPIRHLHHLQFTSRNQHSFVVRTKVPHPTKRAATRRAGRLAAFFALVQFIHPIRIFKNSLAARAEKFQIETQFRTRRLRFELIQQRLVEIRKVANRVRALIVDVINPAHERVDRGLTFVKSAERFDFFRKTRVRRWQHRRLSREQAGLPA